MGWGNKREGAQMDDGYARARESRPTAAFVVWEYVVLVVGFTVSIRIAGAAQVVVAVLVAAIVLFFAIIMIRDVTGTMTLTPGEFRWDPSPRTSQTFGLRPVYWDASWTPSARRLRGFGGQVQLTLTNAEGLSATLWLRHAKAFPIP
jgi:hypothetical protein